MAVSLSSIVPVRSISLPSRLNPNYQKIESELNKLKTLRFSRAAEAASSSPLGSEALLEGLSCLAELYNCIEELVQTPLTQQALNHPQQCKTLVEEALDGSVGLLDSCGNARDLLLTMKEHVQNLQSALRRRRTSDSSSIESNVHAYICFRKKAKKSIAKSLRDLKKMESKINLGSFCLLDLDHNVQIVLKLLRELSALTISVFQSLCVFLSMPLTNNTKASKWCLVSKLMAVRFAASEKGQKIYNEVGSVDVALCSLHGHMKKSDDAKTDVQGVQWRLDTLDCSISGLEAGLERLFRCLLQHRVSLLNLLTP
ncbi:unnamed protein product [Prunus armeniaca]|uniref:DUF241 domain-containing protein n=1 Tax=Prunus armeniaca TaxID=36596 RepID=A0A6J5VG87_PRUAR|nr:unnamed protein product [Prunus armeniaca]